MSLEQRIMSLFEGMAEAHGTYAVEDKGPGKKGGKALTIREPVTEELWAAHIKGTGAGLGIIPIRSDNSCLWGAIDIDQYDLKLDVFAKMINAKGLPLVPFRSKSGGCHLIMFLKEPVQATDLQKKLAEIAASLGYGRSEIFPKQSKVLIEKGDLGNWLNMPYFAGDEGTRYALDGTGKAMSLGRMLDIAENKRLTSKQMSDIKVVTEHEDIKDGPPCLEALVVQGFPEGTRNNGLFALGVYCRKAFPDTWDKVLEEYNSKFMKPPLNSKEVQAIIKAVNKKDYNYKCNDQPICNFCNAGLCRTRQFGIGGGGLPTMTGMAKLPTDQPVWFLDVNGVRLELDTEELQQQSRFQKACMNAINFMPPRINDHQWQALIQALLDGCDILAKPKEAGVGEQFEELVTSFITDARMKANSQEELLLGRPWYGVDPDDTVTARIYIRLRDLEEYLHRHNFKYFTRTQMTSRLQGMPFIGKSHFMKIKGRGVNVYHLRVPEEQDGTFDLPEMTGDVI